MTGVPRPTRHWLRETYARQLEAERLVPLVRSVPGDDGYERLRRDFVALGRRLAAARLGIFLDHVGRAVEFVSPLLLRLCRIEGWNVDLLAHRLRPDATWTPWLCGRRPSDRLYVKGVGGAPHASPADAARSWLDGFAHAGTVVVDRPRPGHPVGTIPFGIRVLDATLEMGCFLGEHRIRTCGAGGAITIATELPDAVMASLPGRPLEDLVGHPLIRGSGCVVTHVEEPDLWGVKVRFALDPVAWRMPWARGGTTAPPSAPPAKRLCRSVAGDPDASVHRRAVGRGDV